MSMCLLIFFKEQKNVEKSFLLIDQRFIRSKFTYIHLVARVSNDTYLHLLRLKNRNKQLSNLNLHL